MLIGAQYTMVSFSCAPLRKLTQGRPKAAPADITSCASCEYGSRGPEKWVIPALAERLPSEGSSVLHQWAFTPVIREPEAGSEGQCLLWTLETVDGLAGLCQGNSAETAGE